MPVEHQVDPAVGVMGEQPLQEADEHVLVELAVVEFPLQVRGAARDGVDTSPDPIEGQSLPRLIAAGTRP
jgi:hypothetical protein